MAALLAHHANLILLESDIGLTVHAIGGMQAVDFVELDHGHDLITSFQGQDNHGLTGGTWDDLASAAMFGRLQAGCSVVSLSSSSLSVLQAWQEDFGA